MEDEANMTPNPLIGGCAGAAAGNKDAEVDFENGLAKLMPFLRVFAQSLSGNRELAEELAQKALAKAWRSQGFTETRLWAGLMAAPEVGVG